MDKKLNRQILYNKKTESVSPISEAPKKAKVSPIAKVVPKTAEPTDHALLIAKWLKSHGYFKWSAMCLKIGLDKGNFHKWINSEKPVIPDKYIQKIIPILKEYGYAT